MHTTLLIILMLWAPICPRAWCQTAGPTTSITPTATEAELLEELRKRAPDKFLVVRQFHDKADSPIVAIYGDLVDASGRQELPIAREFVEKHGSLLGFPAGGIPAELEAYPVGAGTGSSGILVPKKDDRWWWNGTVGFHFNKDRTLVAVTGRYKKMGRVEAGNLDAIKALRLALAELREKQDVSIVEDGIVYQYLGEADDGSLRALYELELVVGDDETPKKVLVGHDGKVLCIRPGGSTFDADGLVLDGYPTVKHSVRKPIVKLRDELKDRRRWPLAGDSFIAKSSAHYKALSTKGHFDFPETFMFTFDSGTKKKLLHPRYLETSLYHHLMKAHDEAVKMGATEVDDPFSKDSTEKAVLVFDPWKRPDYSEDKDGGMTVDNAYFSPGEKGLFFPWYNRGLGFRHGAADLSVVYHEYGHYVHMRLNPFRNLTHTPEDLGDAGAISEGFADFFSMQVSGDRTVMSLFVPDRKRTPSLEKNYCDMAPIYDGFDTECLPAPGKTEIHPAGQLFSGLAMALVEDASVQLRTDKADSVKRVFDAVRIMFPSTFRNFALSVMAVQARHDDQVKLPKLMELWKKAGLFRDFKECKAGGSD